MRGHIAPEDMRGLTPALAMLIARQELQALSFVLLGTIALELQVLLRARLDFSVEVVTMRLYSPTTFAPSVSTAQQGLLSQFLAPPLNTADVMDPVGLTFLGGPPAVSMGFGVPKVA